MSLAEQTVVERLVENRHEFLAFLQRRLGSRALAEDILQEAFTRSLTKANQLENEESAVAWFYRILRNAVTDHQRKSGSATRKLEQFSRELDRRDLANLLRRAYRCVADTGCAVGAGLAQPRDSVQR